MRRAVGKLEHEEAGSIARLHLGELRELLDEAFADLVGRTDLLDRLCSRSCEIEEYGQRILVDPDRVRALLDRGQHDGHQQLLDGAGELHGQLSSASSALAAGGSVGAFGFASGGFAAASASRFALRSIMNCRMYGKPTWMPFSFGASVACSPNMMTLARST